MTTEERIAELERRADLAMANTPSGNIARATVYELRALRLMLQNEIREAAWRVSGDRYVKRDD